VDVAEKKKVNFVLRERAHLLCFFKHLFNISNSNFFSLLISSFVKRHYVDKEKM